VVCVRDINESQGVFDFGCPTVDAAEVIGGVDILQEQTMVGAETRDANDGSIGHSYFQFGFRAFLKHQPKEQNFFRRLRLDLSLVVV
jgi:hypothetical protein